MHDETKRGRCSTGGLGEVAGGVGGEDGLVSEGAMGLPITSALAS